VGDYDADGWPDLYVTQYGRSLLYHNNGNGTFTDVTEKAGLGAPGWASSAVWFDYDGDGDLDIFDAAVPPRLLRNDGGKFTDVTAGSGLSVSESQYCFAAVAGDYDNDGRTDLFVAYGAENKFVLYHNDGNGHFSDRTKQAGITAPPRAGAPTCAIIPCSCWNWAFVRISI